MLVANLDLIGACPPAEPRAAPTLRIIVDYMEKRPERWGEPFGRFGAEALRAAWPCPAPGRLGSGDRLQAAGLSPAATPYQMSPMEY